MKTSILTNLRKTIPLPLLAIAVAVNAYFAFSTLLGVILTFGTILVASHLLGNTLAHSKPTLLKCIIGLLTYSGAHIVILTILFHLTNLTPFIYIATFLTITLIVFALTTLTKNLHTTSHIPHSNELDSYLLIFGALLLAYASYIAWQSGSVHAITSIWHQLPGYFLALIGILIILATYFASRPLSPFILTGLFGFLALMGNLVYRLGFGFDGFIHRASEQLLQNTGTITPAPLYYIGHYVWTVLLSTLTNLSVVTLDKILPVFLFALIPLTLYAVFDSKKSSYASLILLSLPLSLFINPTPQATSLALAIIHLILLTLHAKDKSIPTSLIIINAVAICAIHPLSGIMILVPTLFALFGAGTNKAGQLTLSFFASALFPLAFILATNFSPNAVVLDFNLVNLLHLPHPFISNGNYPLDLIYFIGNAIYLLLPLALILIARNLYKQQHSHLAPASSALITTTLGWILTTVFLHFTTLAPSEVFVYTDRLRDIALVISFLIIYQGLKDLLESQRNNPTPVRLFLCLMFPLTIISSLYLAFPRLDTYEDSNFKNMNADDVAVVHAIKDRADTSYAVLTHQMTSIAALREFGFDNNITLSNGRQVFFYPLPTGDTLHIEFTNLLESTDIRTSIQEIKTLTQAKQIFVALPNTWSNFDAINQKLSAVSEETFEVRNITVWSF